MTLTHFNRTKLNNVTAVIVILKRRLEGLCRCTVSAVLCHSAVQSAATNTGCFVE